STACTSQSTTSCSPTASCINWNCLKMRWSPRNRPSDLSFWFDSQYCAVVLRSQHVQQPIWPLAHIANALMKFAEQRLAAKLLPLIVEDEALQLAGAWDFAFAEAGNEYVSFPRRKPIPRVERHARDAD